MPLPRQGSGPGLALESDALWARTSSDKTQDLAASDSDVTRLRLGLEGSWRIVMDGNAQPGSESGTRPGSGSGASLTPRIEVGARHDGGDAETGAGVELGGGLAWSAPALGLRLDVEGRTLLAHGDDDLEDRGFAASVAYDPDPATLRGPSLTLRQDWGGAATGGIDALFAPDPLTDRTGGSAAQSRWQAEAAYGFRAFDGRFTGSPHVGFGFTTGTREYTLGWRLTPAVPSTGSKRTHAIAADVSLGLKATRRENNDTAPEHALGVEVNAHW